MTFSKYLIVIIIIMSTTNDDQTMADVKAFDEIMKELSDIKTINMKISTETEIQLDKQINDIIHRNLIQQQRYNAYLQTIRRKNERNRRFGLKF